MVRRKLSLYGKRAAPDDILEEINRLLYAKGNRPYPLKPIKIATSTLVTKIDAIFTYF